MATLAEHNRAVSDYQLVTRIKSATQIEGIANAQSWTEQNIAEIVNADIEVFGETTKLSNLHAYASASFVPGVNPAPGEDSTKISDQAIFSAVRAVFSSETQTEVA